MMLVIFTSTIVFTLMIGFCYANAMNVTVASNIKDRGQARMIAESGVQMALAALINDTNWRANRTPGNWVNDASYGGGNLTITAQAGQDTNGDGVVEGSGSFIGSADQPVTLTGTARFGRAVAKVQAVLQPQAVGMGATASLNLTVNGGTVDSYDSRLGPYGGANVASSAEVGTLSSAAQAVSVVNTASVKGDVYVPSGANPNSVVFVDGTSTVTGLKANYPQVEPTPTLTAPTNLGPSIGDRSYEGNLGNTISTNLHVDNLQIKSNSSVVISGNVTIYVEGTLDIWNKTSIELLPGSTLDLYVGGAVNIYKHSPTIDGPDLSRMRLYSLGTSPVTITDGGIFMGVILAPKANIVVDGAAEVFGAMIGKNVVIQGGAKLHQDVNITGGGTPAKFPGNGFVITWLK